MEPTSTTTTVEQMVHGAMCIARIDGEVIFVPYCLPGETVAVRITKSKQDYMMGEVEQILQESPHRIKPRCEVYGLCGGCQLQHADYPYQLELKRQIVAEQIRRIGRFDNVEVLPTVPSPDEWGYRNQARFTVRYGELGFTHWRSHRFIRVAQCPLMSEPINKALAAIQGRIKRKMHQVVVRGADPAEETLIYPRLLPEETELATGQKRYTEKLGHYSFQVSASSFFQVNTKQAEAMVLHTVEAVRPEPTSNILDLYCGVGTFALHLAEKAGRVVGVEESATAIKDAEMSTPEGSPVEFLQASAEAYLSQCEERFDIVVIDPPRSGCRPEVLEKLVAMQPSRIAYVSCNPATLARDLRGFSSHGYSVTSVQPFDMFPHTQHVECVALISRADKQICEEAQ